MYVELKDINKNYGNFEASKDINFGIEKGKLVALLGPSGSGKTTILRMIAGLETPDSGEILIDGEVVNDIPAAKRGIGFVFQNYALFRYMTVWDNIAFGLKVQKADKDYIKQRVDELLVLTNLKGFEDRYPTQLSGGQRQRVAFARALAPNPHLLLLDEPFAAIDAKVRQELRSWLKEMIEQLGVTSIFVTHDQDEAIEVSDQIILTNKGRIEQIGTPLEIYQNPETAFTASFFGKGSKLAYPQTFRRFDIPEDADDLLVRPEFVEVTKKDEFQKYSSSVSEGTILEAEFRGDWIELKVDVDGNVINARRAPESDPVEVGERVNVLVYKLLVTENDKARILYNESIREPVVVI